MKLKREQTSFMKFFKGLLFFGTLLLVNSLSAQVVSIVSTDPNGAEITSPGAPDTASFTISRNFNSPLATVVNYAVTGTSTSGTDHNLANGSVNLNFLTPLSSITTIVSITDDLLVEGVETIIITLTTVANGTINPLQNSVTLNITDNDVGLVSLDTASANFIATVDEDGTLQLPVEFGQFRPVIDKANGTSSPLTVNYQITGSAVNGVDYNLTNAVVLTFANNGTQLARNIRVAPIDDLVPEPDETVQITLISTDNLLYTIGSPATATITIIDNDCAAGTTAPTLNGNPTTLCDVASVNLNSFVSAAAPAGSVLSWSTVANPTEAQLLTGTAITAAPAGTYYALFTAGTGAAFCTSPTSAPMTIILNTSPFAGNPVNGLTRCNEAGFGESTAIDLDNAVTGEDAGGTWTYISGGTGNPGINGANVVNFNGEAAGTYVFRHTVLGAASCPNDTTDVTITVAGCDPCIAGDNAPVLDTNIPTTVCDAFTNSFNDYTNSNPPAGTVLTWSTDSDPLNTNAHLTPAQANNPPTVGGTYYGFFYDAVNTCSSPTLQINLVLNTTPTLSGVTGNERCGPGTVILAAMASDNGTINWYTSASGGSIIGMGSSFTTPTISTTTSYFAEATLNGCASERQEAIAIVQQQPSAGTLQNGGNASACNVAANGPTILDLDDLISGEDAGAWTYTSGPFADFTIPSNNILNFEGRPDGDYVFTYTTTGAQAPCMDESAVLTISVNDCDVDTDMDGLFDGPEAILGTDPNNPDTDGDGINDGEEVGDDLDNPLDSDLDSEGRASPDGIIDALDSNILDTDNDGVVDQLDPGNENPCVPIRLNGVCDFDGDGIPDSDEVADGSDPDDPCDPDLENSACNAEVDLEILKAVDNFDAVIGETVVFTITVNNLSEHRASRIIIGDLLESGFEYVSHSPVAEQYNPDNGEWAIPLIDAMGNAVLEITANILEGGTYTNIAELLDVFQTDTNDANNVSEPITLPIELPEGIDLVLEKTALSANPLVNEEIIFTIKVINASVDANPVKNIEVSDVLDTENFEYIDHNTLAGEYDEGSGIWSIPSLDREQEVMLEIRVRVPNEGEFTNTASIVRSSPADGNPANNEATVEVTVSLPTPADVGFLFNQFSPNGDGTNDVLKINRLNSETNQEVEVRYTIQIFNRYGNLVYEASNKSESEVWDGSWEGKDAPNGTYFYTMNLDIGDGPKLKKGWIQLIR